MVLVAVQVAAKIMVVLLAPVAALAVVVATFYRAPEVLAAHLTTALLEAQVALVALRVQMAARAVSTTVRVVVVAGVQLVVLGTACKKVLAHKFKPLLAVLADTAHQAPGTRLHGPLLVRAMAHWGNT